MYRLISFYLFDLCSFFFFFNDTATTEIYTLSLHDALPISGRNRKRSGRCVRSRRDKQRLTGHVVGCRPGHLEEVAATTGAGRIREVQVETVIALCLGDLALLSWVVEAGCWQWCGATGAQHVQRHARNRSARHRVVDDAIRPDRQVQILEVAARGHREGGDPLQPVCKGRVGVAQLGGIRTRSRRGGPKLVAGCPSVRPRPVTETIDAACD